MSESIQKFDDNHHNSERSSFQYAYNVEPDETELTPQKVVSILLRYKWLVLLFLIAGAVGSWFYADSITPTYESEGTMMISSNAGASDDELSSIISKATGHGINATLENELQVLKSRNFASRVAEKFLATLPEKVENYPILWAESEEGGPFRVSEQTVTSRIRRGLDFQKVSDDSDVIAILFSSTSPEEAAKIVNLTMDIYVKSSTRQNRQAAASTADYLENEKKEVKDRLEAAEQRLHRYMDATGIVQVDKQASGIITRRVNLETELQEVNLELNTIGEKIDNYEKQLEQIKPGLSDQFSKALGPRIRNAQEELARFENERTLIISKNPGVEDRDTLPPRLVYVDKQIERLTDKIKELSSQLFTKDEEFLGMNSEERAKMVSGIQSELVELKIEQNQYQSRKKALEEHKVELESNFEALPQGMIKLAQLKRDVRINEELFVKLSRQLADISVWRQSQFGYGRIVDDGEIPTVPVSPNKKIFIILGLMLGGALSAGFIFIKEFNDNTIKSASELRENYPRLLSFTVVPSLEKVSRKNRKTFKVGDGTIPKEVVLLQDRSSIQAESIRRLKNNIIYQYGETPPQTVAVTSPEKGDGKSTIVSNLGIALAEEGYKTLIIDADFRCPRIHTYFGLDRGKGLSDFLMNKITFKQLLSNIRHTDLEALKVLTAGTETTYPQNLANNKALKEVLKKMENVFDVILLDNPPFGIISDSTSLLKTAESVLVVARYRKTNQGMLLRTVEELERINANVTDIVVTDFDYRKEPGGLYGAGDYQSLYDNYEDYNRT
ncbi:GumC family protein [Fodinibius saliphilus]|uniref:GumC family protein n=1 Tax=Fodinibius saliphilus TaxID=1920650 RepID=UPI0011083FBB|nr:polysaccharide biosynthesis tyrosine autokinase [Fodinibius saliphilus]